MINLFYVLIILLIILLIKLYLDTNNNNNTNSNSDYDLDSDPNFKIILQQMKNNTERKINNAVEEGFANGYNSYNDNDNHNDNDNTNNNNNNSTTNYINNIIASNNNKATLMLFYKKECPYCQDFMPVWNNIINNLPNNVKYEEIECNENRQKANENNITGVPTIILLVNNNKKIYMGNRSYNDINIFMKNNGINLIEKTFEKFDSTGYSSTPEPTLLTYNQFCPSVTFDKQADVANDKYMFQIFNADGQYGYATGNTKDGSVMTPFNAAYSVVDSYLSSLPDGINNANECAKLYSDQIRSFDLCNNDKLNEILQYQDNVKNGTARFNFDGTDYSSNNNVVKAIKNACQC